MPKLATRPGKIVCMLSLVLCNHRQPCHIKPFSFANYAAHAFKPTRSGFRPFLVCWRLLYFPCQNESPQGSRTSKYTFHTQSGKPVCSEKRNIKTNPSESERSICISKLSALLLEMSFLLPFALNVTHTHKKALVLLHRYVLCTVRKNVAL